MKKVIIIGAGNMFLTEFTQGLNKNHAVIRNDINELTESESKIINPIASSLNKDFVVKIKETPRNKFIDKPIHNYKKR